MLAQRGSAPGMPDNAMQMLMFMAGMGFPEFVRSMDKLKGEKRSHHAQGMKGDAQTSGGMAPPLQLAQLLARQQQMQQMFSALKPGGMGAMGAMGMGGGLPGGAPAGPPAGMPGTPPF